MAAQLSIKLRSLNSENHCIVGLNIIALLPLVFYKDSRHLPKILKHYSWRCFFTSNAKLFRSTALSTGYFVDVSLAIKLKQTVQSSL